MFRKVTIYSIKDPFNNDLDKAILGALIKAMQKKDGDADPADLKDQLYFSVKWNRPDSAAKYIFNKNRLFEVFCLHIYTSAALIEPLFVFRPVSWTTC